MKTFVVGKSKYYDHWLDAEPTDNLEEADVIIFTGGEDITPSLYHDYNHTSTRYNGIRDAREIGFFNKAMALDKKVLGICRGSQLLTVLNGGRLIQDVSNHAIFKEHEIIAPEFGEGMITSTHHQMMFPFDLPEENYEIVAHTPEPLSNKYEDGRGEVELPDNFVEPEIVYYPKTRSLAIQGHPERMDTTSDNLKLIKEIFNHYLG